MLRFRSAWKQIEVICQKPWLAVCVIAAALSVPPLTAATAQAPKPNIIVIMGDDIGWYNIGAYNQGLMYSTTPNLDKVASEGHALHRLLRRAELHRRPCQLHHRRTADPHRPDHGRPGGRQGRHAGRGADDRDGA